VTTDRHGATVSRRAGLLRTLSLDIAGPLVVFEVCRKAGVPTVWALVVSGFPPAVGVLFDWVRWRTLEVVGAVVLGGIALSIVLALLSNDPRVVLLEGAAMTAAFGVACLLSLRRHRPLIFYFAQAFFGGRHSADGVELDADYDRYERARFYWRVVTVVWAATYFAEATVKTLVVQNASTQTALVFNRTAPWAVSGVLLAWMFWWASRLKAEKAEAEAAPVAPGSVAPADG
jgi:hypothetical protein